MEEMTKQEQKNGEKVISGPRIYFWVISILAGIGSFSIFNLGNWLDRNIQIGSLNIVFPKIWVPFGDNTPWLFLALYVAALVGLYMRKGWAVPVGRAALVVSMVVLFPVGTIFGAILWKRFNDPAAKRYLNYGIGSDDQKDQDSGKESK
jgi:hypothetical protein